MFMKNNIKKYVLYIFCLVFVQNAIAQDIKHNDREYSSTVVYANNIVTDINTAVTNSTPYNINYNAESQDLWTKLDQQNPNNHINHLNAKEVKTFIKFAINHNHPSVYAKYMYQIYYTVKGFKTPGNTNSNFDLLNTEMLTISYDPENLNLYQDIQMKSYYGYYRIEVQITDIIDVSCLLDATCTTITLPTSGFVTNPTANNPNDMAQNWTLEVGVSDQQFVKDLKVNGNWVNTYGANSQAPEITKTTSPTDNYLKLAWKYDPNTQEMPSPVMYELEWTYVDNYKVNFTTNNEESNIPNQAVQTILAPNLKYNFINNSTRIITDKPEYDIPLIYKRGYILYRVRIVRPDESNYKNYIKGPWSQPSNAGIVSTLMSNSNNFFIIDNNTRHLNDLKNWNYNVTFAEEGKSKHVVNYYDGLLKNRQNVTKLSSLPEQSIVAETFYNYNGKPALQTLPIPIASEALTFKNNFAENASGAYGQDKVDNLIPTLLPALNAASPANNYYSVNNFLYSNGTVPAWNYLKHLPNANGFPLIQTKYDPIDGRVTEISGTGDQMQLGSGKESQTIYLSPEQLQLNKYFGVNIGNNSFYEKVINKDPNNQLSFTINDNNGKVRMSGLMGFNNDPNSPLLLPDHVPDPMITPGVNSSTFPKNFLLKDQSKVWNESEKKFGITFFQETPASNILEHKLAIPHFRLCTPPVSPTNDWFLNIPIYYDISFFDKFGTLKYNNNNSAITPTFEKTTTAGVKTINNQTGINMPSLDMGKHSINYNVWYKKSDIENLVEEVLNPPAGNQNYGPSGPPAFSIFPPCFKQKAEFIQETYANLPDCDNNFDNKQKTECEIWDEMLMDDIAPGGMYGAIKNNEIINSLGDKATIGHASSIFAVCGWKAPNKINSDPAFIFSAYANPQMPVIPTDISVVINPSSHVPIYRYQYYLKSKPLTDVIPGTTNTTVKDLLDMPIDDFISNWNEVIAKYMLPLHPEYFQRHKFICDGSLWDEKLANIKSYNDAVSKGLNTALLIANADIIMGNLNDINWSGGWHAPPNYNVLTHIRTPENLGSNIYTNRRIDQLVFSSIFCGNDPNCNTTVLGKSEVDLANDVANAPTDKKDRYILEYIQLYIANRNNIKMRFNGNNSNPFAIQNNSQFNPNFVNPTSVSSAYSLGIEKFKKSFSTFWENLPTSPTNPAEFTNVLNILNGGSSTIPANTIATINTDLFEAYADDIVQRLGNCISTLNPSPNNLKADLIAYMNTQASNKEWLGGITPEFIKDFLTNAQHGYILDDLCNPWLLDYTPKVNTLTSGALQNDCKDYVSTVNGFLSRSDVKNSLSNLFNYVISPWTGSHSSSTTNIIIDPNSISFSLFEKKILESFSLSLNTSHSLYLKSEYNNKVVSIILSTTITPGLTNSIRMSFDLAKITDVFPANSAMDDFKDRFFWKTYDYIYGTSCYSKDANEQQPVSGIYPCIRFLNSSHGNDGCSQFKVNITGLSEEIIDDKTACITCKEMREKYKEFTTQYGNHNGPMFYNIKGEQHPMWETVVQSFFNYRFGKKHSAKRYMDFMQSCNLAENETPFFAYAPYYKVKTSFAGVSQGQLTSAQVLTNPLLDYINNKINPNPIPLTGPYYDEFKDYKFTHFVKLDNFNTYTTSEIIFDMNSIPKNAIRKFINMVESYPNFNTLFMVEKNELKFTNAGTNASQLADIYVHHLPGAPNHSFYGASLPNNPPPQFHLLNWIPEYDNVNNSPSNTFPYIYIEHVVHDGFIVENGQLFPIKKYAFTFKNTAAGKTKAEISQTVYDFNKHIVSNIFKPFLYFPSSISHLNADNITTLKKDYLTYTYSLNHTNKINLIKAIEPDQLMANIIPPGYTNNYNNYSSYLSYYNIDTKSDYEDLYLKGNNISLDISLIDPSSQFSAFDRAWSIPPVLPSTNNTHFVAAGNYTITPISSLANMKVSYIDERIQWILLYGPNYMHKNIFIRMPEQLPLAEFKYYKIVNNSIKISPTSDKVKRFIATIQNVDTPAITYQVDGKTDFELTSSPIKKLDNVLLCNPADYDSISTCAELTLATFVDKAEKEFEDYKQNLKREIVAKFEQHIQENLADELNMQTPQSAYATTLYGYDRVGNLIYTVPPEGVEPVNVGAYNGMINDIRNNTATVSLPQLLACIPDHKKQSIYYYNSLNQLMTQTTPDAGTTNFYYDKGGRLLFSQNAKQSISNTCSYTSYDNQSRIIETGEVRITPSIFNILQDLKNYTFAIDNNNIKSTLLGVSRTEVTHTFYDDEIKDLETIAGFEKQSNLRSRVATIASYKSLPSMIEATSANISIATHYSYDVSGNVKTLTYDMPLLEPYMQRYKRIDYDYDLYSGKVTLVSYNRSFADQYYQRYEYDADNRITKTETSKDGILWETDAVYKYYPHGPLARVGLGDLKVQGVDFVYTLQGWLKSINGDGNNPLDDENGLVNANITPSSVYQEDLLKSTLHYFVNDYTPIDIANASLELPDNLNTSSLFNGNIAAITSKPGYFPPLRANYQYDQLNRLKNTNFKVIDYTAPKVQRIKDFSVMNGGVQAGGPPATINDLFKEQYTYSLDGNIETLKRFGLRAEDKKDYSTSPVAQTYLMDDLNYIYQSNANNPNNKLESYTDLANRGTFTDPVTNSYEGFKNDIPYDISTSPALTYDAIGNLTNDSKNQLSGIRWSLYGKMLGLNQAGNKSLAFSYDPMGNRFSKSMLDYNNMKENHEYYIRDASGNILAIYKHKQTLAVQTPYLSLVSSLKPVLSFPADLHSAMAAHSDFENNFINEMKVQGGSFFTNQLASKNVGYYVQNNPAIKSAMVNFSPNIVAGINTFDQTALTEMFNTGYLNTVLLEPMIYDANPVLKRQFFAAIMDTTDLNTMQNILTDLDNPDPVADFDDFVNRFINFSNGNSTTALNSLMLQIPYATYFAGIPTLFNNQDYVSYSCTSCTNNSIKEYLKINLASIGNSAKLASYSNQDNEALSTLNSISTPETKMATIYHTEGVALMQNVLSQANGDAIVAEALKKTDEITPMKVMNGLLNVNANEPVYNNLQLGTFATSDKFYLAEHHLYGSSRLGTKEYWETEYLYQYDAAKSTAQNNADLLSSQFYYKRPWYSKNYNALIKPHFTSIYGNEYQLPLISTRLLGQKKYELTNHLGNVMTVVSDKIIDTKPANTNYPQPTTKKPGLYAAYDYYPFGMLMPDRYLQNDQSQCTWISQNIYTQVMIDQWVLNMDNNQQYVSNFTPMPMMSGTMTPNNSQTGEPGNIMFEGEATEATDVALIQLGSTMAQKEIVVEMNLENLGSVDVDVNILQYDPASQSDVVIKTYIMEANRADYISLPALTINNSPLKTMLRTRGDGAVMLRLLGARYRMEDQLQGTRLVEICNRDDFDKDYRFGFNGQHKDNEIKGVGNSLDFGARIYDSRLGKWLSLDPLMRKYPSLSPFNFVANSPIMYLDPDGRIITFANKQSEDLFNSVYNLASKEFKARIDKLKASKVEYLVNTQAKNINSDPSIIGLVSYDFDNDKTNGIVKVEVADKIESNEGKMTTLADELTGAAQFEEGKIGFLLSSKGTQSTIGADMSDEIDTKNSELQIAEAIIANDNTKTLSPDLGAFKSFKDKGKTEKYFKKSEYGKMYKFSASSGTNSFNGKSLTFFVQAYTAGAIKGFAFKANVNMNIPDEGGNPSLSSGGDKLLKLTPSSKPVD